MWTEAALSTWRSPSETLPSSSQTSRRRANPRRLWASTTVRAALDLTAPKGGHRGRPRPEGRAPHSTESPTKPPPPPTLLLQSFLHILIKSLITDTSSLQPAASGVGMAFWKSSRMFPWGRLLVSSDIYYLLRSLSENWKNSTELPSRMTLNVPECVNVVVLYIKSVCIDNIHLIILFYHLLDGPGTAVASNQTLF